MHVRCKMKLENVVPYEWGGVKAIFRCLYDPQLIEEDRSFQKATPTGVASFQVDNPTAIAELVIGRSYYFDITALPAGE
jgi:hypothetical protein